MGFLDDVESIVINNKEVQSIIDSNGGIIYEKSSGGYELVLTGNKSIIQTGESVTLSATLTNNNVPVSGKIVTFDGLYGEQVITTVEDTSIIMNGDYKIILPNSQSNHQEWISIQGTDKNIIFGYYYGNTSYYMEVDGFPIWITGNSVQVIGSSIYYVDENGEDAVLDVSDCNYNTVLTPFQVGGVILETIFSSITDNNGVASVTYTGKGVGDIDVQASWGIIQSEIYSIEDCIYIHDMTTNDEHWSPLPSNAIFNENGLKIGNCTWTDTFLDRELPVNCSIEFNLMDYTIPQYSPSPIYLWDSSKSNRLIMIAQTFDRNYMLIIDVAGSENNKITYTIPRGSSCRIEVKDTSIDFYVEDRYIWGKTYSMPSLSFWYSITGAASRNITFKNYKIKPL